MRVLVLNADYQAFLDDLYAQSPGLAERSYDEQVAERSRSLFGVADFYPLGFQASGVEAVGLYMNNRPMQLRWAFEHGLRIPAERRRHGSHGVMGGVRRLFTKPPALTPELAAMPDWARDVLAAQIEHFAPDVILNQAMHFIDSRSLRMLGAKRCLIAGQIAAPWWDPESDCDYDLIVSSLPNYVARFDGRGIRTRLVPLGFAPRVLNQVPAVDKDLTATFVGTLSMHHLERIKLLEFLASRINLNIWGMGIDDIPVNSPIRACFRGQAWGKDMYAIFRRSKVVINQHIGIAGAFANNMRLFEATGCGVALVTDHKDNLQELFEPDREVVAYRGPDECLRRIEDLLASPDACEEIGRAGQARTCRDHTYEHRTAELKAIFASMA